MDSRTSTCTSTLITTSAQTSTLTIDAKYVSIMSKTLSMSSTPSEVASSSGTFRPSPLNPKSNSPESRPTPETLRRKSSFPASRPLRPFPSIVRSMSDTNTKSQASTEHGRLSKRGDEPPASPGAAAKRAPKQLEISSKWRGGFFVLGMTQEEFSRRG